MQHSPYEFEADVHWLKEESGADIEAGHEIGGESEGEPNIGLAYLASAIVVLVSFSGVVLANGFFLKVAGGIDRFTATAAAFACGVLIYAACALLLPEGLYLIGSE